MIYIYKIDDIDEIRFENSLFVSLIEQKFGREVVPIEDYRFCDTSGITGYVGEEIKLMFGGVANNGNTLEEYIDNFGVSPYLNYPIQNLSGGWRKYISYSLRLSTLDKEKIPLIICASRFLSATLVKKIVDWCEAHRKMAVFLEMDITLIQIFASEMEFLYTKDSAPAEENDNKNYDVAIC